MVSFQDVLTNILVTADYPEVKREGFLRTFYEYLLVSMIKEIEATNPELYQKLMNYFSDTSATDREIQEGLQEAYGNPEIKEKMDKVVDKILGELVGDVAKYASDDQKKRILASVRQE